LHLIALNQPKRGDMHGIRGADYECHRQARKAGFRGTYRAFLSTQTQDVDSIIYKLDRKIPIVNSKDEMIFNSWDDLVNGAGGYFNNKSTIYSFDGKDIMHDPAWPQKIIWHGSNRNGQLMKDEYCNKWHSMSRNKMGLGSSLMKNMLLDSEQYSCNNAFIVLCVENTSQRNLR
ncbi:hypothetical protein LOTGIDRAFT_142841, partial [Lottia gigantea]